MGMGDFWMGIASARPNVPMAGIAFYRLLAVSPSPG